MFEENELDGVTNDDPNVGDDTPVVEPEGNEELSDADLAAKLQAVKDAGKGEAAKAEPAKTETPVTEPAKVEPAKPTYDDAEVERRIAERMAEADKRHTEDKQRAIDAVIAKERKREESAIRRERDFKARTGKSYDEMVEIHATHEIERLQVEDGLTESAARRLVEAQQKADLLQAQEAERQQEHADASKTMGYEREKMTYLSAPDTDAFDKSMLLRYANEIDDIADRGRGMTFEVARDYILGKHRREILAELRKDADAKLAAKAAEVEKAREAGQQAAMRNIGNRAKAAPETGTQGVAQKQTLDGEALRFAIALGNEPEAVAKATAVIQKGRKR